MVAPARATPSLDRVGATGGRSWIVPSAPWHHPRPL